ncbi:hypothetical protein TNCV_3573561 [Trichonephila clavipes]|nr:hypothetical protein TNCV_3573561 [Trichonephila clavipes]
MSNDDRRQRNWRDAEVVHRPNHKRNGYRGYYWNGSQRNQKNQGFESRSRFDRDNQSYMHVSSGASKSLAIQDSQNEDTTVDEGNLRIDILKANLIVGAGVSSGNIVESIVEENIVCAVISDLVLSSRVQLVEEQRRDPELDTLKTQRTGRLIRQSVRNGLATFD